MWHSIPFLCLQCNKETTPRQVLTNSQGWVGIFGVCRECRIGFIIAKPGIQLFAENAIRDFIEALQDSEKRLEEADLFVPNLKAN